MKTASFYYPYDSVFKLLEFFLTKKGCPILSMNKDEGIIHARCKRKVFIKGKMLDIKVKKINHNTTAITLIVNSNLRDYEKAQTDDERIEEELLDSIYHQF